MVNKTIRLNRYLAMLGLGSRRKVEDLITTGHIQVNHEPVSDPGCQVLPDEDSISLDGKLLKPPEDKVYIMLHKPPGYLVSDGDPFHRKTVFDLLPNLPFRLFHVGRLDYQSEGLLLITNDGEMANAILHPSKKLPKIYRVTVSGVIGKEELKLLQKGVDIGDDHPTMPARVFVKKRSKESTVLRITIHEGRKRQIRRMMKAVGHNVLKLKRLQIGELRLGSLPPGMWRFLEPSELRSLRRMTARRRH